MKNFLIVLKYTILENARKKTFIVTTIILVLLTILLFNINNIADSFKKDTSNGQTDNQNIVIIDKNNIYSSLNNYKIPETNYLLSTTTSANIDDLKKDLNNDKINSIVMIDENSSIPTFKYIVKDINNVTGADIISNLIKSINMNLILSKYNVNSNDLTNINTPVTYEIVSSNGESNNLSLYVIGIIASLVLYMAIYFYGYSVSMSISSEKTSRVMETLITSTKPSSIVLGKTVAMGLLGLGQLLLLILTGILSYNIFTDRNLVLFGEKVDFSVITLPMLLLVIVYFLLGYFLYAMMNAVAGSTVSKAEDIQSSAMPVSFISLMSFYLGYFSLATPNSPMTTFASIFPFSSAFTMPSRMLTASVPIIQVILSILLLLGTISLLAYLSIRIYSAAILYYGQKLKLKDLFKMSKDN